MGGAEDAESSARDGWGVPGAPRRSRCGNWGVRSDSVVLRGTPASFWAIDPSFTDATGGRRPTLVAIAFRHEPVLLNECLEFLDPQPGSVVVDATVGGGGHAAEILTRIAPNGTLIGLDLDREALGAATQALALPERFPVPTKLHKGLKGFLYNGLFVPGFNLIPRFLVRRLGWHLMAYCRR